MELPSCPMGYTHEDIKKIFSNPIEYAEFMAFFGGSHSTCNGFAAKDDRKSKLQRYATVCVDHPHGPVWTRDSIDQFLRDYEEENEKR